MAGKYLAPGKGGGGGGISDWLLFPWQKPTTGVGVLKPDIVRQAVRTPTAPSTPRKKAPAPKAAAPKRTAPAGPTPQQIAARERAAAESARKAAEAKARKAANNAARERATSDIEKLNSAITANKAKLTTNTATLESLKNLVGTGKGSHASVRDNALATLDKALKTKLAQITETFTTSLGDFHTNLRDNEETESDASFSNLANRARETQDVVSQALSQGAGESDVLKTQLLALRNWNANQSDINRSFFDTRSSINAGITDLNNQTHTGMINEELSTNATKGSKWDEFYEAMGNTYSDMSNLDQNNYLLQAEIDATEREKKTATGLLSWLDDGKNYEDWSAPKLKTTAAAEPPKYTSKYADLSAQMAGSSWKDPGISKETQNWEGGKESTGDLNTSAVWNVPGNTSLGTRPKKRPEGATLRRW